MNDEEFEKHVRIIEVMALDYLCAKEITKEAFIANLADIIKLMKGKA